MSIICGVFFDIDGECELRRIERKLKDAVYLEV